MSDKYRQLQALNAKVHDMLDDRADNPNTEFNHGYTKACCDVLKILSSEMQDLREVNK